MNSKFYLNNAKLLVTYLVRLNSKPLLEKYKCFVILSLLIKSLHMIQFKFKISYLKNIYVLDYGMIFQKGLNLCNKYLLEKKSYKNMIVAKSLCISYFFYKPKVFVVENND